MKKSRMIIAVIVIAVLAGGGFLMFGRKKKEDVQYTFGSVSKGRIIQKVSATGTVNPEVQVLIGSQVSGKISELFADFNSPIKQGQMLAKIDPLIYQSRVDQAKFNLNLSRENMKKNEVTLKDAEKTLKRMETLNKTGFASDKELDDARTAYDSAVAQIGVTKAQIDQLKAALEEARTNLKYTNIISPVDGIIVTRNVDVGQTVVASMQTPTLFVAAKDLTRMKINTNVDEADIGKISVGQDVEFTVDAYPERTFNGKVSQIRNSPLTVQNVVTYDVVIDVSNPELILKPGMTTNVNITTSIEDNVLRVPNAALRFIPRDLREQMAKNLEMKKKYGFKVWKLGKDNSPVSVDVKPGVTDDIYTQIAGGDIKENENVIVEAIYKE